MKCPMYEELFINTLWGSDWQRYAGLMSQGSAAGHQKTFGYSGSVVSGHTAVFSVDSDIVVSQMSRSE